MLAHAFRQGPAIGATLSLLTATKGKTAPITPGPELTQTVAPRPRALVDDYLRVVGGDPRAWKGHLPPHMFPQWGWPIITRCLHGLPYDLTKVVNAGCSWTVQAPLPDDQPLELRARLAHVDDDGRRALITVQLETGTAGAPAALTSSLTAFVPLPRKADAPKGDKKDKPAVPLDAQPIGDKKLGGNHGWRFALVTGDFNPIHWIGPYAKVAGFGGVILHGFCTAAIAAELVIANRLAGDVNGLSGLEARFTSTLRLPGQPTVYLGPPEQGRTPLYVGTAPGGPAFLVGAVHV